MSKISINVVFGILARNVLRDALKIRGRREGILTFPDDLSIGPIDSLDGARRLQWLFQNFFVSPEKWGICPDKLGQFFAALSVENLKIVCWMCANAANECCGLDACMHEIKHNDIYIMNTMSCDVPPFRNNHAATQPVAIKLAHLSPAIASQSIGKEVLASQSLRAERRAIWHRMRGENAPLRTIGRDGIESVPISYFDELVLAQVGTEWVAARRVVAVAAAAANDDDFFRVDMMVLAGRLQSLVDEGRIDAAGDISDWATMTVRLP